MKSFNRYILLTANVLVVSMISSKAQDINPTVEVSRTFEGKVIEAHKPLAEMAVPDSVLRFDMNFDYSVFDNPFKGAGGFNPYLLEMTPEPAVLRRSLMYLKAGVGYGMRPELDAVFSPRTGKEFKLDVYAKFNSYIGDYRTVFPGYPKNADMLTLLADRKYQDQSPYESKFFSGHDMRAEAGVNGRWDWTRGSLTFDIGYEGAFAKDYYISAGNMNGIKASLRAMSKRPLPGAIYYDASVSGRYDSSTAKERNPVQLAVPKLFETFDPLVSKELGIAAIVGPVLNDGSRILADFGAEFNKYGGILDCRSGNVRLTPKYEFENNRWRLSLGLKFSVIFGNTGSLVFSSGDENIPYQSIGNGQFIYPDLHIGYEAVRERLNIFFTATGGDNISTYQKRRDADNFFDSYLRLYSHEANSPVFRNSSEQYNVAFGIEGNVATVFRYGARVGHRSVRNDFVQSVRVYHDNLLDNATSRYVHPWAAYGSYRQLYVQTAFFADTKYVDVTANAEYRGSTLFKEGLEGFAEAPFSAFLRAEYSAKDRLFAGIFAEAATARNGYAFGDISLEQMRIPGYVDLGLNAKYMFNSSYGLWFEARNLLGMNIQRTPLYAQRGLSFTAGICINL